MIEPCRHACKPISVRYQIQLFGRNTTTMNVIINSKNLILYRHQRIWKKNTERERDISPIVLALMVTLFSYFVPGHYFDIDVFVVSLKLDCKSFATTKIKMLSMSRVIFVGCRQAQNVFRRRRNVSSFNKMPPSFQTILVSTNPMKKKFCKKKTVNEIDYN